MLIPTSFTLVTALITDIDEFNKFEEHQREEIVRGYDFEGQKEKMLRVQEIQDLVI